MPNILVTFPNYVGIFHSKYVPPVHLLVMKYFSLLQVLLKISVITHLGKMAFGTHSCTFSIEDVLGRVARLAYKDFTWGDVHILKDVTRMVYF